MAYMCVQFLGCMYADDTFRAKELISMFVDTNAELKFSRFKIYKEMLPAQIET